MVFWVTFGIIAIDFILRVTDKVISWESSLLNVIATCLNIFLLVIFSPL